MTALDLDPYVQMGYWGNIPIYAQAPMSVRSEKTEDIRALDWDPGSVVFPL